MQKSIVLICLLSIGVFWSWSEAEAVTYSATVKIACPTLIAVGDSKELTVTASGANEPEYDTEEFVLHEGQWSISVSPSLTLIPPADLDGESGSATYHLSSGVAQKVTYTATATKTYTFSRKEGVSTDIELPESVTYSGSDTKDVIFVAIAGMQYKIGSMEWTDANEVIKVPKGSSVSFRVLRAPDPKDTSEWPSGWPKWSGSSGASGTGREKNVAFNKLSTPGQAAFWVEAKCGTSMANAAVWVVEVEKLQYYNYSGSYVDFPNEGTVSAPKYVYYTEKSQQRVFVQALNTMGSPNFWPEKPEPKPVWTGADAFDASPPWQGRVSFEGHDTGDTIDVSAECGNTKDAQIVLVGIEVVIDGVEDDDATTDNEKLNPGSFLPVKKRKSLAVKVLPDTAKQGLVTLSTSGLDVYETETGGNKLTNLTWNLANGEKPEEEYFVVSETPSAALRDKWGKVQWQLPDRTLNDEAKATVVGVDIAAVGQGEPTEATEENPGTFIEIEKSKNVTIKYYPGNLDVGELKLSGGGSKLEFYDGTTKLSSPQWNLANTVGPNPTETVPGTITIKGIDHGEVELSLQHTPSDAEDKLKVTVYELILEAVGKMVEMTPGNFLVPIMLNDNWDCQKTYAGNACAATCPRGCPQDHRELEPIWDLNYCGSGGDGDLVEFNLEMRPNTMPGDVELSIASGSTRIRLWPSGNKGSATSIIVAPQTYAVSALPKAIHAEGIGVGDVSFKVEYKPPTGIPVNATKTLAASVISLVEKQGGVRKIINANATPIDFTVEGGAGFNGKFTWATVPPHSSASSLGKDNAISVRYGAGLDVNVAETAVNRRFESDVEVSIDGKLTLKRKVRVAQATYQGTPVATTIPARRIEVPTLATPPAGFDNTEPSGVFSQAWFEANYTGSSTPSDPVTTINSQRLQYAPNATGNYGEEILNGALGIYRKVYAVFVLPDAYLAGFKQEDLQAIAEHECQHARQDIAVKTGGNNWRVLDDHYKNAMAYGSFAEADSQLIELQANASWKFLTDGNSLALFDGQYGNAMNDLVALQGSTTLPAAPTTVQQAAKEILQDIYRNVPADFIDMKRHGTNSYDWSIRAPE